MKDKEARERLDDLENILEIEYRPLMEGCTYKVSKLVDDLRLRLGFSERRLDSQATKLNDLVSAMTELTKKFSLLINHLGLEFEDRKAELIIRTKVK